MTILYLHQRRQRVERLRSLMMSEKNDFKAMQAGMILSKIDQHIAKLTNFKRKRHEN